MVFEKTVVLVPEIGRPQTMKIYKFISKTTKHVGPGILTQSEFILLVTRHGYDQSSLGVATEPMPVTDAVPVTSAVSGAAVASMP